MKQIRKSVFETNSSSTHVLSIEGLKGIREYTKQPLCKYSIDLVASNMLQSRLADGDKMYLQGINPIFANPDLEDRQYTKTLSKAKLYWTYLMQNKITGERLENYVFVMNQIMQFIQKYYEKDWKIHFLMFDLIFFASDEYLEVLKQKKNVKLIKDTCQKYRVFTSELDNPLLTYILLEPLSNYHRCKDSYSNYPWYADDLDDVWQNEYTVNWQKKARKAKNQKYTETIKPEKEWGVFDDHFLAKDVEAFDEVLKNKKYLKAVLTNDECVYNCKRIG